MNFYTIAKGDIFANIAKAKGVSLKALVAANPNVGATKLKVGQKIHIPAAPSAAVAGGDAGVADGAKTTTHVVKSGDTLAHIAKQHGTTIKAIQAANGLKTTRITIGQKLKLPAGKTTMAKADVGVPVKTIGNHPGSPTSTNQ